jgi:hypothetical protein
LCIYGAEEAVVTAESVKRAAILSVCYHYRPGLGTKRDDSILGPSYCP